MKINPLTIIANLSATLLLLALVISPLYFAKNFSQVAGARTESRYLLISQTDKFPNTTFTQIGQKYHLSFTKQSQNQVFLSIFIINNPTTSSQRYILSTASTQTIVFFGQDLKNLQNSVIIPAQTSIPISILAKSASLTDQIEFTVN